MLVLTMRWMPCAACTLPIPSAVATRSTAASAAGLVELALAAEKPRRVEIAEHQIASVTVAASPPWP